MKRKKRPPRKPPRRRIVALASRGLRHGSALTTDVTATPGIFLNHQSRKEMQTGIVKIYFPHKGFGFITPTDGGKDIFVHVSQTGGRELVTGEMVAFEMGVSERTGKPQAVNVKVVYPHSH
jgi:cold shock protein